MKTNTEINTIFLLDDTSNFEISGTPQMPAFSRWQYPQHCNDKRYSLIMVSSEQLKTTDTIHLSQDTNLFIRYTALSPKLSTEDLSFELQFLSDQQLKPITIAKLTMTEKQPYENWNAANFDLTWLSGHKGQLVINRPSNSSSTTNDLIAIAELCIARVDQLALIKSKSFNALRTKNEIAHFSNAYKHEMYTTIQDKQAKVAAGKTRPIRKLIAETDTNTSQDTSDKIENIMPNAEESSHGYASRLLSLKLNQTPPNFIDRLNKLARQKDKIKVLSLCSGAARIEAGFSAASPDNIEWSLLDINTDLLNTAASQFPESTKLDLIEADANNLVYSGEKWDVILCVSALHHLIELEKVIKFISKSLNDDGEFWSIGEYVGRNGNRLWPDARYAADTFFAELPKKYRLNAHSGKIDQSIPDNDYSVGCFEGIRSEDIEPLLDRWLQPEDVYRRNCFLWRLINLAYSDNYDLNCSADLDWIRKMVDIEFNHFKTEGRGTELFGVYKARKF